LFIGQYSFDDIKPFGTILFISITTIFLALCLRMIFWAILAKTPEIIDVVVGHAIMIYLLFGLMKNTYVRSYGDEIIGSYFEKDEYHTQYYVNLFEVNTPDKKHKLPAKIHVYSETEEDSYEDKIGIERTAFLTSKYIDLKKIYWPDGNISTFDNCHVEMGKEEYCTDEDKVQWSIVLTDEKVE
jgi:hypothetical protein